MRSGRTVLAFVCVSLVVGCASINVNHDFDPMTVGRAVDFETYSWLPDPGRADPRLNNSRVAGVVMTIVDEALTERGYRMDNRNPDFLVGWHAALDDRMDVVAMNSFYGYGWNSWRMGGTVWTTDTFVREYTQGALVLDVVDGSTNELIWRGAADSRFNLEDSLERREQLVRDAVELILSEFPPQM